MIVSQIWSVTVDLFLRRFSIYLLIMSQITFGVAPTVMLYSVGFHTPVDQVILIFFVLCGVARLARFNVTADLVPKNTQGKKLYCEGLPISYAALAVSTVIAAYVWMDCTSESIVFRILFRSTFYKFHPAMILVIALGAMMISKRLRFSGGGPLGIPATTITIAR